MIFNKNKPLVGSYQQRAGQTYSVNKMSGFVPETTKNDSKSQGTYGNDSLIISDEAKKITEGYILPEVTKPVYTQRLVQGMNNGTGNGNPNATGRPIQVLNAKLFNISIAFGEISAQNTTNNNVLRSEFRTMILSIFDDAALALHGEADAQKLDQARAEARSLAGTFLNKFFNWVDNITPQNLLNTGMSKAELAFHEAMNFTYHEVG
ncbi:MAG: hypothetical protein LBH91_07555, partial [Prevotellaceae bacterium]|nr:hypothetical protein [Prevotellaceae bacterium]